MRERWYDWDRLFAGDKFTLAWGRDFVCSPAAMLQQVRSAASAARLRVRTRLSDDWREISVRVLPRTRARGKQLCQSV